MSLTSILGKGSLVLPGWVLGRRTESWIERQARHQRKRQTKQRKRAGGGPAPNLVSLPSGRARAEAIRWPQLQPLQPPPLAAAPPPLSPGLAHPSPCRSAHLLRHPRLPGASFPGLSPRFQAVAPRHSGAWPLRACVCLTAPFSTLAAPFPVSLCPSGSVEDKRSGSPGTVRFYPGTSLDVRGEMSSLTLSQHPQTSSRPPRPLLPCIALSSPVTAPLSAARGRGVGAESLSRARGRTSPALPLPTVSPPSPCPRQPGRRRTLAPDSSTFRGERRDTRLEGDWDLGVGAGVLVWVG